MNKLHLAVTTTNPKILDEFSKDENYYVRRGVASNPNASPEILNYLSEDEDWHVRCWVASNLNTTPETLKQMSIDEDEDDDDQIIYYIKRNPNCSEELYRYLSALEILKTLPEVST